MEPRTKIAQNVFWRDLNSWFQGSTSTFLVPTSLPPTFNRLCSAEICGPSNQNCRPVIPGAFVSKFWWKCIVFCCWKWNGISAKRSFRGSSGAGEPSENVRFWHCSGAGFPESHGVFSYEKMVLLFFSSLLGLQAKIFSKWKRNSTQLCCGWIFLHAVGDNTWAYCFCLKVKGFLVFVFRCCFLCFVAFLCCTRWLIVHLFLNLRASFCSAWFHLFSCFFVTEEPK